MIPMHPSPFGSSVYPSPQPHLFFDLILGVHLVENKLADLDVLLLLLVLVLDLVLVLVCSPEPLIPVLDLDLGLVGVLGLPEVIGTSSIHNVNQNIHIYHCVM